MRTLGRITIIIFFVISGLFWFAVILNWHDTSSFGLAIFKTVADISLFFSRLKYGDPGSMLGL
jgi:hypothetical protein